ncbi:MAG: Dyp-type peroxidase [Acidimicrobiales bacterium]
MSAQAGIFAVGASEHGYVELDLLPGEEPAKLVAALAALQGPGSPMAGVGTVVGFRPELWSALAPGQSPPDARSFESVAGPEFVMPATQHDAWLWVAGVSRSAVFDAVSAAIQHTSTTGRLASETNGWVYQTNRDLTGFVDGTENPSPLEASDVAVTGSGSPAAGSSVVLYQRWLHLGSFSTLSTSAQEKVIGRTKPDSTELGEAEMPADSHVARNVIEVGGKELAIYRRNTSYGTPSEHGTLFVGFCASAAPLQTMLESMAGLRDGIRDALTRYTAALSGAYYVIPSIPSLSRFVSF